MTVRLAGLRRLPVAAPNATSHLTVPVPFIRCLRAFLTFLTPQLILSHLNFGAPGPSLPVLAESSLNGACPLYLFVPFISLLFLSYLSFPLYPSLGQAGESLMRARLRQPYIL